MGFQTVRITCSVVDSSKPQSEMGNMKGEHHELKSGKRTSPQPNLIWQCTTGLLHGTRQGQ